MILHLREFMHLIQGDDWFVDVFDEHEARYMLYGEHLELGYG